MKTSFYSFSRLFLVLLASLSFLNLSAQATETFVAQINGVSEVPNPVTSTGVGSVTATLDGNSLVVSGTFSDLTSDFDANVAGGAHLHLGLAGQGGGITQALNTTVDDDLRGGSFDAAQNTYDLTDEQVTALRARGLYLNIHTLDYPAGEIRGQLVPQSEGYARAFLLGVNQVPSIVSPARGGVIIERNGNEIVLSGGFSALTGTIATQIAGGAHIHTGVLGRNGGVIIPLKMDISDDMKSATFPADSNRYTLTDVQLEAMLANGLYVNVHSSTFLSGEIRGQITDVSTASLYADLSGHQARPAPINTDGDGRVQVNMTGNEVTVFGSVGNLSDTVLTSLRGGAHLHLALAGRSGGIVFELTIDQNDANGNGGVWTPANNTFTITEEQRAAFLAREYYVNVHTTTFQSGEVRGQVMNLAKGYYGSNLAGINAKPQAKTTTGNGFLMYELMGDNLIATGSFQDLISDFDANVAGGSHIHVADAANSGGIAFELDVDVADNLRSGVYQAASNKFTLSAEGREALAEGEYYFNLHTVDNPSGEIRGQLLRDDNAFPSQVTVESIQPGTTITVSPSNSDVGGGTFTAAQDPDGDLVVYAVEFRTAAGFIIDTSFTYTIGTDTTVAETLGLIYDTLIAVGASDGTSIPLEYRVVASDGSVSTRGEFSAITVVLDQTISTANQSAAERMVAYPNPFQTHFTVEVEGLKANVSTLTLLDINGREVGRQLVNFRDGRVTVPAPLLSSGTYLIRLTNEAGVSTQRVVKR
ncbi:CHRD domain-containing protein [Neolewinella antarctica]|uniref:CHRD domain-containing protein n=1 Tax=Neolewinella antarctica TaxID=442734 RepID=A0ABX0X8H5_9BACT|nr:CHRD domain-containing protein [Neolewinella antarctica]NJC25527.1 hypothetical protein [Neolewinella antarctica]